MLRQIRKRGRDIERNISAAYLEEIQNAYLDYLKTETETPVVILDLGKANFERDDAVFQAIANLLAEQHPEGATFRSL